MIRKGTYVLEIALDACLDIRVGALGTITFPEGLYCYTGSAMGGIDQRVSRHILGEKRLRWHADYLTVNASWVRAFVSYPDFVPECELARMAEECGMEPFAPGFGCSDCRCRTHLFRTDAAALEDLEDRAGLVPFELFSVGPNNDKK
ncbi:GIY-YIG nuclease family protein [Candidatus Methanoprimaticola sp. MG2]|uniref:GIY-YIG nuclease family protein n=1 Tax=Candidatus Methanoprimaticola sp. MG2 TaxID=3228838 RepID=UPI0039C5AA01